jgi:hypothetical protein
MVTPVKAVGRTNVLDALAASDDIVDRELARTLRVWQDAKAERGLSRSLGYEPRDINLHGSRAVIENRIRKGASGFWDIAPEDSYEAIVDRLPAEFPGDLVAIARSRLSNDFARYGPTDDAREFDARVTELLNQPHVPKPRGVDSPKASIGTVTIYSRDPKVKAYILQVAAGRCEACESDAPFRDKSGQLFLEIHHVKRLADGGSDKVSNAVGVCPNCHRAFHNAHDTEERTAALYSRVLRLVRE